MRSFQGSIIADIRGRSGYDSFGESLDYEQGVCTTTQFEWEYTAENATLTIHPAEGDLSLLSEQREFTVVFKGFSSDCRFFMGEEQLTAIYDSKTASYTLTLGDVNTAVGVSIRVLSTCILQHNNSDYYERIVDLLTKAQCELTVKKNGFAWWIRFAKAKLSMKSIL